MMFLEGLTAISAQKHFQIKFINIAIYCNNFFDIAIYRNTFLGPQYPALLGRCARFSLSPTFPIQRAFNEDLK